MQESPPALAIDSGISDSLEIKQWEYGTISLESADLELKRIFVEALYNRFDLYSWFN
jgi:hypothetical protein